jgi:nicotinamidase-related amidase
MKTCLLVIDAQESFRHRDYFTAQDLSPYLNAQNALIEGASARNIPIVRIFHNDGPPIASNPWAIESGLIKPIEGLRDFTEAKTFFKEKHSALVGTGLVAWLQDHGISRLMVSGIRTEQCCETTTRHASDLGFEVDYCLAATLTFDMELPDGSPFYAADIKARTASVLKGRFATIVTPKEALERI